MTVDYERRLAISYYKTIAVLNEEHNIYLAQHQETGKIFVKKILDVYNLQVFEYLKQHPVEGLPAIIDFYEDTTQLILIEEYITGDTLQDLIEQNHLTVSSIYHYTQELCKILDTLHSANPPIVHRDVKPSNIIITNQDHVVLLDFNAAKKFNSASESDTVLLGTKGYAAPEQYGFGASSPRTDIYALGIVLKEMCDTLGGAGSATESIRMNTLHNIIHRCTQFKPEDRFASVQDIAAILSSPKDSRTAPTGSISFHNITDEDNGTSRGIKQKDFTRYPSVAEPDAPMEDIEDTNVEETSLRRFLPPGYRTHVPWKVFLSSATYAFLIYLSRNMETDNPLFNSTKAEGTFVSLCLFAGILIGFNYMGIQSRLPLCNFKNPYLRLLGIIFITVAITFALLCAGIIFSVIVYGT